MYSRYYEFNEEIAYLEQGKIFKEEVQKHIPGKLNKLGIQCLHRIQKELPVVYKQIEQSANGANVSIEDLFGIMSYEFFEVPFSFDHCTDITVNLNGHILKGHNEDLNGNIYNTAIIKHITGSGWYT